MAGSLALTIGTLCEDKRDHTTCQATDLLSDVKYALYERKIPVEIQRGVFSCLIPNRLSSFLLCIYSVPVSSVPPPPKTED
jgi:hypothetical protein